MVVSKGIKNRIIDYIIILILIIISFLCIIPIINTLAVSLSDKSKASAGLVYLWPVGFTLASYEKLINDPVFLNSFLVSIKRVLVGGAINMFLCIIMAYPLSREQRAFRFRNVYMWTIVFTMLFNGGLIPWYMTIRTVGLIDKFWALVLPGAVNVFNIILLMNFFRSVPKELEEATAIDGAGPWYTLWKIFVPISMPAIATITLFTVVGHWNSFFDGLILMNKPSHYPLQTYIQQLVVQIDLQNINDVEQLKQMMTISNKTFNAAKIFVSMIPILLVYPFLQRYFVTGIVLGSVKG
jgi:putative aldouronate transport system permease protein